MSEVEATTPSDGGTERWRFETGRIRSSPTVVDDVVYIGSDDESLHALAASDGREQWSVSMRGRIRSSPCVVDGLVYVGDHNGYFSARDRRDGSKVWSAAGYRDIDASPTVFDGTVYVGSDDRFLRAYDARDGSERWTFETRDAIRSSPTVVDGTVYVGNSDPAIYAVDADSGDELWQVTADAPVWSSPTVHDGRLFVGDRRGFVYGLDASDGEVLWRRDLRASTSFSSPTVDGDTVYIGTDGNGVHALDVEDGSDVWTRGIGDVISSPTVAGDRVYVGSRSGTVYALDATDGTQIWTFSAADGIWKSSPTVVDGLLYVGTFGNHDENYDGVVHAIETGHSASSSGTRVRLGTLGHHDHWAREASSGSEGFTERGTATAAGSNSRRLRRATVEDTITIDGTQYRVLRDIPDERPYVTAYVTDEYDLVQPDRALDVAISHAICDSYELEAAQRQSHLANLHGQFENVERLARAADLSGELAGAITLGSISPEAAISDAVSALVSVADWAEHELSNPYYRQYAKMAAASSTMDWANEHVPEPGGSLVSAASEATDVAQILVDGALVVNDFASIPSAARTVRDVITSADSIRASVPSDAIDGVDDLRTAGYTVIVGLAFDATVGQLRGMAEGQAKAAALGAGSTAVQRTLCTEWLALEERVSERTLGPAGALRLHALRQTDYQIQAAAFEGIGAIQDGIDEGFAHSRYFDSDAIAEDALDVATRYRDLGHYLTAATGSQLRGAARQVDDRSLNGTEYGTQEALTYE